MRRGVKRGIEILKSGIMWLGGRLRETGRESEKRRERKIERKGGREE